MDTDGDGKCDTCGAAVSLTVTWDAGSNGGTIDGKASVTTTVKPNAAATAPTSTPIKTGHAFKGWYTSASGGSLYNTVTITASKTFYAQYTANTYTLTWELGDGNTETTKQTYGEKLVLPAEPTRKGAEFLGWFTEPDGGTQVTANDVFAETAEHITPTGRSPRYFPSLSRSHFRLLSMKAARFTRAAQRSSTVLPVM